MSQSQSSQDSPILTSSDPVEVLVRQLAQIETSIQTLLAGQVDAVVDPVSGTPILLRQAQTALQRANETLKLQVQQRTAELEAANQALRQEIAERRRLQETLEQHNLKLERLVEERTAALRASEEDFRLLAEHVPDIIYRYRLKPVPGFEYVSPAATVITGYTPAEHYADPELGFKLIHPDDRPVLAALMQPNSLSGQPIVLRWVRKDGRIIWTEQSNVPIYDPQGNLVAIEGVARDITRRMQTQKALRESEAKLRTLFEILPVGVTILDKDRNIVDMNPAVEKILAISKEGLLRGNYKNRRYLRADGSPMPPVEIPSIRAFDEQSVISHIEIGVVTEDGATVWTDVSAAPLPVADLGVVVVTADITDRKQAEVLLRQSEQKFSIFFEKSAFAASLSRPPDGALVVVNEGFEKAFGYTKQEAVGKTSLELGLSSIPEEWVRIMTALKEHGSVRNQELALRTKSGEVRLFSVNVDLVNIGDQQYLLNTAQDITERKQMEAEKEQLFQEVNQQREQLRALTQQLAAVQEMERQQLAQELHDQIGQNLTALDFSLSLIRTQLPADLPAAPLIQSQLDYSANLINQTATCVRSLMAGLRPPLLDDYGLVAALQWYGEEFSASRRLAVTVEGQELKPRLPEAVENNLFRIVQEALNNAAKHAQASQVTITVTEEADFIHLVVTDNGLGFTVEDRAKTPHRGGWGLLTMMERARAANSHCRIDSQPGQGTRVIVMVPR